MEFDPKIAELTSRGATASLLLDAQKRMCALCVEMVLKRIDLLVASQEMTPDRAVGLVHEIAAFRSIVHRQQQEIETAKRARSV
jgi:hypothetical protein